MEFDSPRLLELLRSPAEDKARLAQAMIALANHGGGAGLLGYAEQGDGSFVPAESRPADLTGYTSDVVNGVSHGLR
jgi:hypothetical protein